MSRTRHARGPREARRHLPLGERGVVVGSTDEYVVVGDRRGYYVVKNVRTQTTCNVFPGEFVAVRRP